MEKLLAIKGVGMSTVIGFVAEVGDIGRFTDPKQNTEACRTRNSQKELWKEKRSAKNQ